MSQLRYRLRCSHAVSIRKYGNPTSNPLLLFVVIFLAHLSLTCVVVAVAPDKHGDTLTSTTQQLHRTIDKSLQDLSKYMATHKTSRPFVTLAYAQTLDGRIAVVSKDDDDNDKNGNNNSSNSILKTSSSSSSNFAISGPESLVLTHALRSMHDAILVGGKTLAIDNPRLNNRLWKRPDDAETASSLSSSSSPIRTQHQPRPVALDPNLRHIQSLGPEALKARNLIVCCSRHTAATFAEDPQFEGDWKDSVTLLPCETREEDDGQLDLCDVLHQLKDRFGIQSIMVEGGASILTSFVRERLVDYQCVTISNKLLGTDGLPSLGSLGLTTRKGPEADGVVIGPLRSVVLGTDCIVFSEWKHREQENDG